MRINFKHFALLWLIIISFNSPALLAQDYICKWSSSSGMGLHLGNSTIPKQYKIDYKVKFYKRNNHDKRYYKEYEQNRPLLNKKYRRVAFQSDNRIIVQSFDELYGVIDNDLNIVLEPKCEGIFQFLNGTGWLLRRNYKWSLVDNNFQNVEDVLFDHVMVISDDHFMAKKNDEIFLCHVTKGIIKNLGNVCFKASFSYDPHFLIVRDGDKKSLYNDEGKEIYELKSGDRVNRIPGYNRIFTIKRNAKSGFVSTDGNHKVPLKYDHIRNIAPATYFDDLYLQCSSDTKRILYKNADSILLSDTQIKRSLGNAPGEFRIPRGPKAQYLIYSKHNKKGFYNCITGYISEAKYDDVFQWTEGRLVIESEGKYGMIDSLEKEIIPSEYFQFNRNKNSIIAIKESKYFILDMFGNPIVPTTYNYIGELKKDRYHEILQSEILHGTYKIGEKFGFYNESFEEVTPPIYDSVRSYSGGYASVEVGDKWGYIDGEGNQILPAVYDSDAIFSPDGHANVALNGKKTTINTKGECIKGCD